MARFYHEIALKKGNRGWFLRQMMLNLTAALSGLGVSNIKRGPMLALIPLEDDTKWPLIKERLEYLQGIERFGRVYAVEPNLEAIRHCLRSLLKNRTELTFRISSRRTYKAFPMTSLELNCVLGDFVRDLGNFQVSLKQAELTIHIQITKGNAFVAVEEFHGLGGLPVGVGGSVAVMLSGGIDSPVAAYQMIGRGCSALFIHFHSFPLVDATSREKAQELVELLTKYQLRSRLLLVPFAAAQQQVIVSAPIAFRVTLYRRLMVRIAAILAARYGAKALVTGDSLGQVSSQTLENLSTVDAAVSNLLILRPLVGQDKEAIVAQARRIASYPISIIPDQDCCSLFVPKHPVIRSKVRDLERIEQDLPIDEMVSNAVAGVEEFQYQWPTNSGSR